MTDAAASQQHLDDARLLNLVRAGDSSAFGVLFQRHDQAARRLARDLVVSPAEVDDVVGETFARVLAVLRLGGGPSDAFRPYLLTALRRVCNDRLPGQRSQPPGGAPQSPEMGSPFTDPAVASADSSLMLRAYLSLPERWAAILWHAEIEQATPADVAPLFGLSRNGVAALSRRARDGLRQAYLQLHVSGIARAECTPVAERLGAFVRDALSGRDTAMVCEHIDGCDECRAVCAELSDVNSALRSQVAPAFLGAAAASYLSVADHDAAGPSARAVVAVLGHHAVGPRGAMSTRPVRRGGPRAQPATSGRWFRKPGRRQRWLGASAAVVLAAVALGGYEVSLTASATSARLPGRHQSEATTRGLVTVIGKPSRSHRPASPKPTPRPTTGPARAAGSPEVTTSRPGVPPTPSATASRPASPSPSPSPTSTASPSPTPDVKLAAGVDVYGQGWPDWVVFSVTDNGSSATAVLTATIVLPAGSSYVAGGGPGHHDRSGWTCEATSSGASCQHAAIAAGGGAGGTVLIQLNGSAACGQPVQVTVTSGATSASAQSPETIQCGGGGGGH